MASDQATAGASQDISTSSLLLRACAWCRLIEIEGEWLNDETAIKTLKTWELAEPHSFTHTAYVQCLNHA